MRAEDATARFTAALLTVPRYHGGAVGDGLAIIVEERVEEGGGGDVGEAHMDGGRGSGSADGV